MDKMDRWERFLRNIDKKHLTKRNRRRLMDRELKKLQSNDSRPAGDSVDE